MADQQISAAWHLKPCIREHEGQTCSRHGPEDTKGITSAEVPQGKKIPINVNPVVRPLFWGMEDDLVTNTLLNYLHVDPRLV